ncbi:Cold shock protein CspA [Aquisphaera giovannonii]|uniref:Cold shock protein CspA n=1 Tax=Aquisphaera giovannonii TaxID=406548 RepID=A0A5B9W3M3_9BACT|nr:cold shock and DUF1294 domain-containing protein [Aquisphaera giovannonii]QEH35216.1 Cold shock protein CspA [Aquisphaera giovannonii]
MRVEGTITGWNDERGFGFVSPREGGDRAFVHIKAFPRGSRRPVDGDLISYTPSRDDRGRSTAADVRLAGQEPGVEPRGPSRPLPRVAIGSLFLLAAGLGTLAGFVPAWVAIGYAALSVVSGLLYGFDKAVAGSGLRRIPEATLHAADLLGGWPGGLIAQRAFHHKTRKASFQVVFWLTAAVNVAAVAWALVDDRVRSALASLVGR